MPRGWAEKARPFMPPLEVLEPREPAAGGTPGHDTVRAVLAHSLEERPLVPGGVVGIDPERARRPFDPGRGPARKAEPARNDQGRRDERDEPDVLAGASGSFLRDLVSALRAARSS